MRISLKDWPIYLLYIMPFAILTGPFFSDLFLIIISIWFFLKVINVDHWRNKYIKNKIFLFFVIFNIYIIFVSLISDNTLFSLKASIFYFRFYLFAFAICFIFENYQVSIRYFFYSICASIVLIILTAFYDLVIIKDFFNNIRPHIGELKRVSGLFGDELIMGSVLKSLFAIFLVLLTYLNYFEKKYINFFTIILILWFVTFTIFISGERISIFIHLIFCVFSGFILKKKISIYKIILCSAITTIILFLSFDNLRERVIDRTILQITNNDVMYDNQGNIIELDKEKFVYLSIHHDAHARSAISMFLSKPIFGYGPKNFRNICKEFEYNQFSCSTHPHNIYLQLASETGLVGIAFLLFAILGIIFFLKKKFNKNNIIPIKIMSTYIFLYFLPFVPSGNFFNNFVNVNFYTIFGIYLFLINYNYRIK